MSMGGDDLNIDPALLDHDQPVDLCLNDGSGGEEVYKHNLLYFLS